MTSLAYFKISDRTIRLFIVDSGLLTFGGGKGLENLYHSVVHPLLNNYVYVCRLHRYKFIENYRIL